MTDTDLDRAPPGQVPAGLTIEIAGSPAHGARNSKSMHADVPIWCDCCSCEAEPYWLEAMAQWESEQRGSAHTTQADTD